MAAMVLFVVVACGLSEVCFHRVAAGTASDKAVGASNVLALLRIEYCE